MEISCYSELFKLQVFSGNTDAVSEKSNSVSVFAQYVRVRPISCPGAECAIRIEMEGCQCTSGMFK